MSTHVRSSMCTGNPQTGTLANSEDSDEMLQQKTATLKKT